MERDSFIVYAKWQICMDSFPEKVQSEIRKAIFYYAMGREVPEMSPRAEGFFFGIKSQMDANAQKYDDIKEKRKEAGRKSGEARKNKRTSVHFVEQTGTRDCFVEHNDNVNVNVNDITPLCPPANENPDSSARQFIRFFNDELKGTCIPQARVTDSRLIKAGQMLIHMGKETMEDAVRKIKTSILATEKRGVGFDWMMNEDNVVKVIEGTYEQNNKTGRRVIKAGEVKDYSSSF